MESITESSRTTMEMQDWVNKKTKLSIVEAYSTISANTTSL